MGLLLYPYFLLVFWYRDFFLGSVKKSVQILAYTTELMSFPLLIKTFFKPLKNEYHEGLVLFSIIAGIIVKSFLLISIGIILALVAAVLITFDIAILILPPLLLKFIFL